VGNIKEPSDDIPRVLLIQCQGFVCKGSSLDRQLSPFCFKRCVGSKMRDTERDGDKGLGGQQKARRRVTDSSGLRGGPWWCVAMLWESLGVLT
jgi:hypothetical protein